MSNITIKEIAHLGNRRLLPPIFEEGWQRRPGRIMDEKNPVVLAMQLENLKKAFKLMACLGFWSTIFLVIVIFFAVNFGAMPDDTANSLALVAAGLSLTVPVAWLAWVAVWQFSRPKRKIIQAFGSALDRLSDDPPLYGRNPILHSGNVERECGRGTAERILMDLADIVREKERQRDAVNLRPTDSEAVSGAKHEALGRLVREIKAGDKQLENAHRAFSDLGLVNEKKGYKQFYRKARKRQEAKEQKKQAVPKAA